MNDKEALGINEWLELIKEDKNLKGAYISIAQYIYLVEKENQQLKEQQKEFIKYLEEEKDRLARECSQIYEDSLGKTKLVNEDIFNEINKVLSKYKEIIGSDVK